MLSVNMISRLLIFWIVVGLPTVTACPEELEVVFVVDGSGSVGSSNWMIIQNFLVEIITRFTVGHNNVRVGMITFGSQASTMWRLDQTQATDTGRLSRALSGIRYPGGNTATSKGLEHARSMLTNYIRPNVESVVVVITDGKSNRYHSSLGEQAHRLRNVARVIAIGVGNYDRSELELIATSKCDIFTVADFDQMNDNMNARMDQICGCMPGHIRSSSCTCVACPMGKYQLAWGQTQCDDCPRGATSTGEGNVQCHAECPAGYHIDSTGQRCEMCNVGTYQSMENEPSCVSCPPDFTTKTAGAQSVAECKRVCPAGQYAQDFLDQCVLCSLGSFQPSAFSESCIVCPDGYSTRSSGSTSMSDCELMCDNGQFAHDESGMCLPCPVGEYQNMSFTTMCTSCEPGYSTRQNGSMSPNDCKEICDPGFKADQDEMACIPCPKDTYQSESFSLECITCPGNTKTKGEASTSVNDCQESAEQKNEMSAASIAGLIVGLILLFVLLAVALLLFLLWRRKKAYAQSRSRAQSAYDEIETSVAPAAFVIAKGSKKSVLSDNGSVTMDRYAPEPSKQSVRPQDVPQYSLTAQHDAQSSKSPYDNSSSSKSPYDNSSSSHSPYDNSKKTDVAYDNPVSQAHLYDNIDGLKDGYDRPPTRPSKSDHLYANA